MNEKDKIHGLGEMQGEIFLVVILNIILSLENCSYLKILKLLNEDLSPCNFYLVFVVLFLRVYKKCWSFFLNERHLII